MMLNRGILLFLLFFSLPGWVAAQLPDSLVVVKDSTKLNDSTTVIDSSATATQNIIDSTLANVPVNRKEGPGLKKILDDNIFLNSTGKPFIFVQSLRKTDPKEGLFYVLAVIILLFAILKVLYPRYFSNLFRVFLNTSLRQSQLTDQLLQAKLPSLLYNIFFILIGGGYLYLLLNFFGKTASYSRWQLLLICAASLLAIYFTKYCILKFTGWITGYKQEADTYIFIIFLINKILAICLMPIIVIISFSDKALVDIAVLISFIMIATMILMRFFRSYSLLQNRLKVSRLHFFIYIIGIEIIPLLVIYKLALIFMSKSL